MPPENNVYCRCATCYQPASLLQRATRGWLERLVNQDLPKSQVGDLAKLDRDVGGGVRWTVYPRNSAMRLSAPRHEFLMNIRETPSSIDKLGRFETPTVELLPSLV
jgi:hypothetical protein